MADVADMAKSEQQRAREETLAILANAYQRRDLSAFEETCRPDMTLTLAGKSQLAGTYHGYKAFAEYLSTLRTVLASAQQTIEFEHPSSDAMLFHQTMVVMGPRHQSEMRLDVTVTYAEDGRIQSFDVRPDDQGLFDYIVDTGLASTG